MHKNSPGIRRVACRDDGIPIRRLRPHTYTHTQRNSISRLRIHALAWGGKRGGKSVWYRGDAAIEEKNVFHSYYAAYSSQSTGLPPRAPKSFSLLQKPPPPPSVRRPVNTPVLRPRSGNHSSGIRHSIFNFVPPYTKSRHSREIPRYFSLFDLLSTGLPHSRAHSAYLPARVLLLEYEFTAAFPPSYEGSRLSENLLPTATQPCVIPTTLPPSSNPPSPLIPYTDLSYTRAPRLQWSRTFHPFSRLPPGHAPFFSILPIFHRFLALLLPSGRVYSAK